MISAACRPWQAHMPFPAIAWLRMSTHRAASTKDYLSLQESGRMAQEGHRNSMQNVLGFIMNYTMLITQRFLQMILTKVLTSVGSLSRRKFSCITCIEEDY